MRFKLILRIYKYYLAIVFLLFLYTYFRIDSVKQFFVFDIQKYPGFSLGIIFVSILQISKFYLYELYMQFILSLKSMIKFLRNYLYNKLIFISICIFSYVIFILDLIICYDYAIIIISQCLLFILFNILRFKFKSPFINNLFVFAYITSILGFNTLMLTGF